jgi:hypothetical protein
MHSQLGWLLKLQQLLEPSSLTTLLGPSMVVVLVAVVVRGQRCCPQSKSCIKALAEACKNWQDVSSNTDATSSQRNCDLNWHHQPQLVTLRWIHPAG